MSKTTITMVPLLVFNDTVAALDFYRRAFGAAETFRIDAPDGKVAHAEMAVGGSRVMLTDEQPGMPMAGPRTLGKVTGMLCLYLADRQDVDSAFQRALGAGATVEEEPSDQFYGEYSGVVVDPFGHRWALSTVVEDITDDEVRQRAVEMFGT